jgi:hypothetical protein
MILEDKNMQGRLSSPQESLEELFFVSLHSLISDVKSRLANESCDRHKQLLFLVASAHGEQAISAANKGLFSQILQIDLDSEKDPSTKESHVGDMDRNIRNECSLNNFIENNSQYWFSCCGIDNKIVNLKNSMISTKEVKTTILPEEVPWLKSERSESSSFSPVHWSDIGGMSAVRREILDVLETPFTHPELFAKDCPRRQGLLFYGPPGSYSVIIIIINSDIIIILYYY